jgi:hypothetical protein
MAPMPDTSAASRHQAQGRAAFAAGFLVLAVGLAACSGPAYVDMRREAGQVPTVGAASLSKPVICYSVRQASPQEVLAMAQEVCARTDRVPLYQSSDWLTCTLRQPRRAVFQCVAPGTAGANRMPPDGRGRAGSAGFGGPAGGGFDDWSGGIYPEGRPPSAPRL